MKSQDKKSPQQIKRAKQRTQFQEATGITFPEGDLFGQMMATKLDDALRTGARRVNPDEEDSPIHCSAEWHFARYSGPGSSLVYPLYGLSWHLSKTSGSFYPSLQNLAKYLNLHKADDLYAAANLLVVDGFWEVVEREEGRPVKYRPIGHDEWKDKHPHRCTQKIEIEYAHDDPELMALGKKLGAILGGERFYKNILLGIRNAAPENTDAEICAHGKMFLAQDKGKGSGKARRARFIEYLRSLTSEATT